MHLTFLGQLAAAESEGGGEGRTEVPASSSCFFTAGVLPEAADLLAPGALDSRARATHTGPRLVFPRLTILFLRRTPSCLPFVTTDVNSPAKGAPGASRKTLSFAPQGAWQRGEAGAQQSTLSTRSTTPSGTYGKWRQLWLPRDSRGRNPVVHLKRFQAQHSPPRSS